MTHKHWPGSTVPRQLGVVLLAVLAGAPALAAQDAATLFQQGVEAWRAGDTATARSRFQEVVRMEPSRMDALRLLHESQDVLLEMLYQGDEWERIAREILTAARTSTREHMRDPDAAREAAAGVFSASGRERAQPIFRLSYEFGPFAVPPLVAALNSSDGDRRLAAVYALSRLGSAAAVPLMALLDPETRVPTEVRLGAVQALGLMEDHRADAWLADLATRAEEDTVRVLAGQLATGDPVALHLEQGRAYLMRDLSAGLTPVENQGVRWYPSGASLAWVEVPRPLVPLDLAAAHFFRAMQLGSHDGAVDLALTYASEVAALEALSAEGEDVAELLGRQVHAALSLPPAVLDEALQKALSLDRPAAAAALVRLLDAPGFQPGSGLRAAAGPGVAAMARYPAVVALAHAGQGDGQVVEDLARASGFTAPRVVVLVDDNAGRRSALAKGLAGLDVTVMEAEDGAGGIVALARAVHVDALVVADPLPDLFARRLVRDVRRNPRFADVPVFVLGNDETGDIEGATVVTELAAGDVVGAFGPLGAEREANLRLAVEAASALADLARVRPDAVGAVTGRLAAVLDRAADPVAVAVLEALAWGGSTTVYPELLPELQKVVVDGSRESAVRVAAATAMAGVLARNPGAEVDLEAIGKAAEEGDADLARACARVLGLAGAQHRLATLVPTS